MLPVSLESGLDATHERNHHAGNEYAFCAGHYSRCGNSLHGMRVDCARFRHYGAFARAGEGASEQAILAAERATGDPQRAFSPGLPAGRSSPLAVYAGGT